MSVGVPEVVTRVTPLGIRLRDEATGTAVRDGLVVSAGGVAGILNSTDVFVFSGLPGLGATERGAGDAAFWSSPPVTASYQVLVDDALGRFQPFSFSATAPHRGLFDLPCAAASPPTSPPALDGEPAVPLFSAPARPAPAAMAVVRAEIQEATTGAPASFAVLEVDAGSGGPSGRGFADAAGRVMVILPYPALPSGLGSGSRSLALATWTLSLHVRYAPAAATGPHPDLCAVLGQPAAVALAARGGTAQMSTAQLAYGLDLVLASAGTSVLLVN